MATATALIASDVILNRRHALATLQQFDWSIVLQFGAIFLWVEGFHRTHAIEWIWKELLLTHSQFNDTAAVVFLVVFVVIGSNCSSSFLLTLMVLNQLTACLDQLCVVLYLAWAAALAGNLTLFGSVANFIVIQQTEHLLGHRVSFWGHLQFGFLTTLLYLPIGAAILFSIAQTAGM